MSVHVIQRGETLTKIAKQYGVSVEALVKANNIKNANTIFAGSTLNIPTSDVGADFNIKGLHVERANSEQEQNMSLQSKDNSVQNEEKPVPKENKAQTESLTDKEVMEELRQQWVDQGYGRIKGPKGEKAPAGEWSGVKEMVCRDDSGKTQNIQGKFKLLHDTFEFNPEAFTITDNSSGEDHKYLYKKVAVDSEGNAIYKAVSMNGRELGDNQYTLKWTDDKTPELVQYSKQDNFGIGLFFKKLLGQ